MLFHKLDLFLATKNLDYRLNIETFNNVARLDLQVAFRYLSDYTALRSELFNFRFSISPYDINSFVIFYKSNLKVFYLF